ncbi:hypothetical protein [Pedobacter antarcticus]|uniref:hypothetical protein n=1 Tax=Pedobacter antarcticus TaxID=34086 RepID=UPI00292E8618|nr:hypothetical protein [Pedobacter antarcticus]
MKFKLLSGLAIILLLFSSSCKYFRSSHPQADILSDEAATNLNDKTILNFAAGVDRELPKFRKQYSLIYTSGDLSVYTEKFSDYNNSMLYRIYSNNGSLSSSVKSYYFRADSLMLIREKSKFMNQDAELFRDSRTYLRNGIVFGMDTRTASSADALRTLPFLPLSAAELKTRENNFEDEIKGMDDALTGKDKFEMVFDNIATYPDARFIMLKSKSRSNYKAAILVEQKDTFIDSLLNYPGKFRDTQLKFKWVIEDKQAVYVPVSATNTSASGLNK